MYGEMLGKLNVAASNKQISAAVYRSLLQALHKNVDTWIHCMHTLLIIARGVYFFVMQVS
jgi:hypothetical protein